MKNKIKVVELFAGVGGFRLGLEGLDTKTAPYQVIWSNQWEPTSKQQHASEIYKSRFGESGHSNVDIAQVTVDSIPDHDLLVGGFPCQDYSVARTLTQAAGIKGKKGVLWWEIYRIIKEKGNRSPSYLLLENVDRLLKSPANQRGRDFAIMLSSLSDLGYIVEWRVINAADYGMPQRRNRVFILAYKRTTKIFDTIIETDPVEWILAKGTFAKAFPVNEKIASIRSKDIHFKIKGDIVQISDSFHSAKNQSPFHTTGIIIERNVYSVNTSALYKGKRTCLGDVLVREEDVPEEYFVQNTELKKWEYLKGAKKEQRESASGHLYFYSEGSMTFPDALDKPARTIVTGEGGSTPSRFKHIIKLNDRYRRLTPIELERLNMFPDNHTIGVSPARRAFLMGNALVVGVVEKIGKSLYSQIMNNKRNPNKG
ncbi:MAG TPA: DNA (cytosine-5-)-methyltransferase [Bacteroidetes bacterium]|nr:DNA (cytosine-5-)-methyltransferase [Bacteroidota bacterium]